MFQVGNFSHLAKSGRLIIRLTREIRPGAVLVSEGGRKLGKVIELIGPVRAPYASVAAAGGRPLKKGDPAFLEES